MSYDKNAHVRRVAACVAILQGAAGMARSCIKRKARQRAFVRDCRAVRYSVTSTVTSLTESSVSFA